MHAWGLYLLANDVKQKYWLTVKKVCAAIASCYSSNLSIYIYVGWFVS